MIEFLANKRENAEKAKEAEERTKEIEKIDSLQVNLKIIITRHRALPNKNVNLNSDMRFLLQRV